MRLTTTAPFIAALFVAHGILAQSPYAEPPESGSPTTGTPDVTHPSSDAFIFCSAPDCTGTCDVVETSTIDDDDSHTAPIYFQLIYWYDPDEDNIQLYTCLDDCLVINPIEVTEPNTCYNLCNNSIPTDFLYYYYFQQPCTRV